VEVETQDETKPLRVDDDAGADEKSEENAPQLLVAEKKTTVIPFL
jgi:hypothetical protein